MPSRRSILTAIAATYASHVWAQRSSTDYPNKPIKIIAPFPTGTGPDANTREIANELSKALGQSVVVENRPGASTMIGMEAGAKATQASDEMLFNSKSKAVKIS